MKFEEDQLQKDYDSTGVEISALKKEYVGLGGLDPEFLMSLMELEKVHKKAYQQIMATSYLHDPLNKEVLGDRFRGGKKAAITVGPRESKLRQSMQIPGGRKV